MSFPATSNSQVSPNTKTKNASHIFQQKMVMFIQTQLHLALNATSQHQVVHINIKTYMNSSLAGCVACECECNVNEQLFSIEDMDDSDLHSGNIPELEYLKSLSRPIMSPHQSCMRSLSPKYVLAIPKKRRMGFKIPSVSNKNDWYHCIHQYCRHDATPALDSRLYYRGRSYNKGQSYDRGWNCIPLRCVLHSPKTCSAFIPSVHLTHQPICFRYF